MVFLFCFNGSTNFRYRHYRIWKVEKYSKILLKPSLLSALLSAYSDAHVSATQPFPDDAAFDSWPQGERHPANQPKSDDVLKRASRTCPAPFFTQDIKSPKRVFPKIPLTRQESCQTFNRSIESKMLFEQKTDVPCSLCGWLHFFYASISHEVALYVINMAWLDKL